MNDKKIETFSPYGDARKQAQEGASHHPSHDSGLSAAQIAETRARLDSFESRVASSSHGGRPDRESILKNELPSGAALLPNRVNSSRRTAQAFRGNMPLGINFGGVSSQYGSNASGTLIQQARPYQPEFDSVDRLSYPVHRILANRYWRLFHKLDPHLGSGIDILSDMWVSKFQLSGEGVEGSIKEAYESQCEETQILGILPYFSREFWVTGEAIPHLILDDAKGYWVHISLHNPDQMEVIDAPFLHMEPIMEFVPDDRLRQVVSSSDPALLEVRRSIPGELVSRIQSGQNIPLDPMNATFLARKLHPYDSRGTSIISRLWRVLMYEDAVFSASILEARRMASPVKVVKMGNERTGWIPGIAAEQKMADLLAKAELDPQAWLVTHYGVACEYWGSTGKGISIDRTLETIERIKLMGLGIPKAVAVGEVTYACYVEGTDVSIGAHRRVGIETLKPGDLVLDRYGIERKVLAHWSEGIPKEVVRIHASSQKPFEVTKTHQFPVYRNSAEIRIPASEIRKGDYLMLPRGTFDRPVTELEKAYARVLGYYVAEGDIGFEKRTESRNLRLNLGLHEWGTFADDIVTDLGKLGVQAFKNRAHPTGMSVRAGKKEYDALFRQIQMEGGSGAANKVLSENIMAWPLSLKREFIQGVFKGDGNQTVVTRPDGRRLSNPARKVKEFKQYTVQYTTTSEQLSHQLRQILIDLGFVSRCHRYPGGKRKFPQGVSTVKPFYLIAVTGDMSRELGALIWGEKCKAPPVKNRTPQLAIRHDEFILVPVKKTEVIENNKPVYNLTVSGTHSYLAAGVATFNSAEKGLQVLLHRLKTFRNMVESKWMRPKFFRNVAKINDWRKISKSESRHGYRMAKKTSELQDSDYIVPNIEWETPLSPRFDADMQKAILGLEQLGVKISKGTKAATATLNYEEEKKKVAEEEEQAAEEAAEKARLNAPKPGVAVAIPTPPNKEPVGEIAVPLPPIAAAPPMGVEAPLPPASSAAAPVQAPLPPQPEAKVAEVIEPSNWEKDDQVRPLVEYLQGNPDPMIDSPFWSEFYKEHGKDPVDSEAKWDSVEDWLADKDFLTAEINQLHRLLVKAGSLRDPLGDALDRMPDDPATLSDAGFDQVLASSAIDAAVKKKPCASESGATGDNFLTGEFEAPSGIASATAFSTSNKSTLSKWTALSTHFRHKNPGKFTAPHGRFEHDHEGGCAPWEHPVTQEARTEWQARLDKSKLPDIVKSRIKYLENASVDHWKAGFDTLWGTIQKRLNNKMRLEPKSLRELMQSAVLDHINKMPNQGYYDALADIYAEGKLQAYKPLRFDETKRKRLKTASMSKIAVTVDTVNERQVLDNIAESALSKVTDTVTDNMKAKILDALTQPGAYSESVTDLANKLIKEQRKDLEADPSLGTKELQDRVKELYDTQLYNIQRIMRTESINAYAIANLRGYQEQGIEKVKWNSHHDLKPDGTNRTCNICLALDGIEFEVAYMLSLGAYPMSTLGHIGCRCYLTPVIVFVSFDDFEKEYEKTHPTEFVSTETVVDPNQVTEMSQIIKDIQSAISNYKDVPVEYEEPVTEALKAVEDSNETYSKLMPKTVHVVNDISGVQAFKDEVGHDTAKDLTEQVTHYTDTNGTAYVSGFAVRDEAPSNLVIKTWAQNIWDKDVGTRTRFGKLYDDFVNKSKPEDLTPQGVQAMVDILEPVAVGHAVGLGPVQAFTLNKKFKEMDESGARRLLEGKLRADDIDKVIRWRGEYVLWDLSSGGVIESAAHPEISPFVNDLASQDPEHMFIESLTTYYTSPTEVQSKSPELYNLLKSTYFDKQVFTEPGRER